jgi:hypothetical protein
VPNCMDLISVEMVEAAIRKQLAKLQPSERGLTNTHQSTL